MINIDVEVLSGNFYNLPKFLAKLTQRGHEIHCIGQIEELHEEMTHDEKPSDYFMTTPHTTLRRMNYITVAVNGLSTKCVSQLRTHAKRLTFVSTSTQYSDYSDNGALNCVFPMRDFTDEKTVNKLMRTYDYILARYAELIADGIDKDIASYILPQGLRKSLIISGNLDDWQYVMQTRMCHRNSEETQHVMKLIYKKIKEIAGEQWVKGMLPKCCTKEGCQEGKMCCGRPFELCELDL